MTVEEERWWRNGHKKEKMREHELLRESAHGSLRCVVVAQKEMGIATEQEERRQQLLFGWVTNSMGQVAGFDREEELCEEGNERGLRLASQSLVQDSAVCAITMVE